MEVREKPFQYDVSVIKQTEKRTHSRNNRRYYRMEYLVTLNGNEVWARDFRGYKDSIGNRFDCSKLQVGHSVIVFKETANSFCYIVSNE